MVRNAPPRVEGHRLRLRLVTPSDAEYVYGLRTNPAYNQHLSPVTGTMEDQREWIERYKEREALGQEYYYLSERRDDGTPCGLVRLYDLTGDSFTWGSWIIDHNKPPKGALECAVLSFGIGFEQLALHTAHIDVRLENSRAIAFYRRFGMQEIGEDLRDLYFEYRREQFEADRPLHISSLELS